MSTTIKKMVYRVWGILDGNIEASVESRFTYREIREAVKSGIAAALLKKRADTRNDPESDKYGNDMEYKEFVDVPISLDPKTKLKMSLLPVELVNYFDGRQVEVFPDTLLSFGRGTDFIPIKKREVFIIKHTDPSCDGSVYYWLDGKRVMFWGDVDIDTVNMNIKGSIPSDDDEEVNCPQEYENLVIQEAYKTLAPQVKPDDNAIDGVPNP